MAKSYTATWKALLEKEIAEHQAVYDMYAKSGEAWNHHAEEARLTVKAKEMELKALGYWFMRPEDQKFWDSVFCPGTLHGFTQMRDNQDFPICEGDMVLTNDGKVHRVEFDLDEGGYYYGDTPLSKFYIKKENVMVIIDRNKEVTA